MKKENRLLTIDGETLMSQPLTPLNFVVDTLISQGLHILAGSPKVGKSWLALWLAVTVAKGESVWGMGVKQGTTLYCTGRDIPYRELALEFDGEDHVWKLLSDDCEQTEQPSERILFLLSELLRRQPEISAPAKALLEKIDPPVRRD